MEELKKKFNSLNLKKVEPINGQNKNNNEIKKDNNIIQPNIKKDITSFKDRIGLFEKKNEEKPKITNNNFKIEKKEPPKINNNNIIINNNNNKLIKEPIKNKPQCKSFDNNKIIKNDLILQNEPQKSFKSAKDAISKKDKINIDNFQIKKINDKIQKNNNTEEIIKIDDIKPINIDNNISTKEKEKEKEKKRFSLLDANNKLTIKLKSKKVYKKEDFEILNFLGKGAYGTVLQVRLVNDPKKKVYAIKKLDILSLISFNRLYQAYLENEILSEIDCPYIVKVYGAFEADEKIHIIMDYIPKGDLAYFIKVNYPLRQDLIKFYAAEMVCFFEYMQKMKLIHRDLKPQNIMIDDKGHLKVIDFGTVRKKGFYFDKKEMKFKEETSVEVIDSDDIKGVKNVVNPDADEEDSEEEEEEDDKDNNNKNIIKARNQRSMTFVGTAEYISPEVIADKPADFGTDIWAFGVMLYQMIFNITPFKDQSAYLTFRKIENAKINYPTDSNNISEEAKDLLNKIFVVEPKMRLGGGDIGTQYDINHLKMHKYFKGIKWNNLINMSPPGFNTYKFYENKRKSIYKKKGNNENNNESNNYKIFDDKSNSNNIKIIKEGYINKQSFWFHYVKRYFALDTTPRIVVTNMDENGKKKVISLNKRCKVSIVKDNCFELRTPEKNYKFKGLSNDGNNWAGIISDIIEEYGAD